ncbi:P-loop NTPase fold protein [Phocaeicola coprocola]
MIIKELKNNILLALYDRYKKGNTSPMEFDKLCLSNAIIYDSDKQLSDAVESLKSDNLVDAVMFINNKGLIQNITPDGVQFVEENILTDDDLVEDSLKNTDKLMKSGIPIDIDVYSNGESTIGNVPNKENHISTTYNAKENYKGIVDSSIKPCFGVTTLAECYIKQLDKIAEHANDNFCMLGLFGPWGRGKTYFFQQIKKLLEKRIKEDKTKIKYKIIEFNAWKYQDTPAIWAYLYETIYKEGLNWLSRIGFYIKHLWLKQWPRIISVIAIYGLVWGTYWYISEYPDLSEHIKSIMQDLRMPLAWLTALSGLFYSIIKNPISIHDAIEKHFKRKSYRGMLGIQNDLEQDLEILVKSVINNSQNEQIILYVDDIDRCETAKMLNVVNSLRLILENKDIQKRMIVICSIDANKFIEAYCCNKFSDYNDTEEQRKEAKEHLNKLFIFGIGLPSLDQAQQMEYLKKLYNAHDEETVTQAPFSTNREKHSFKANHGNKELAELTDNTLGEYLSKYLKENKIVGLTPRKIRIIYYRLLFANNIMASGKALIKDETLDKIIQLSIRDDHSDFDIDIAGSDVVGMVVPY